MTDNQNPEQKARDTIDLLLKQAGWVVQSAKKIDLNIGQGQAVREYQTDVGPADYVLFVDKKAVGVIEAKREEEGQRLTAHEPQTEGYAAAKLKWVNSEEPLPFLYESTGIITRFTDARDPKPRSREVFNFHRPETLKEWLAEANSLRERLQHLPILNPNHLPAKELRLRDCQEIAITNLEASFKADRPRALIQMATGAGKTYTAITSIYRLLKHAHGKRILFLVDTKNLGEQAEQEMMSYVPLDDNRKFTELYNVQRLKSSYVANDSQVCISTIQRLYSILKDTPLDEATEEINPAEIKQSKEPMPVVYNEKVPPEFFDFIFIDECHRSIYNLWQQVIDYFDASLIGLTATPDNRTYGFFKKNVVSDYSHEKAVADGVNVGNEIYVIETQVSQQGAQISAQQQIEKREKLTRKKRWEQQDEDEAYSATQLDRSIVNPDQIRTIIHTFRDKLPEIFPGRTEVPKTLIFAKTDSHADDIIQTVREEFGEGNAFCKKLTYKIEEDPKSVLADFRNAYYPRIAVTVDMIATGTDVKPLECLLFMRDVKSRNYFEQMKGRGTRTLDMDDLKKVTPSAVSAKTHYVIVDAIGVTKSLKTASQPLITKPTVPLKDLAMSVMMGAADEDTVSSLAGRLARLNKQLDTDEQRRITDTAGGVELTQIVGRLFAAIDADNIEAKALELAGQPIGSDPGDAKRELAQQQLVSAAASVLNGELVELIETIRRDKEQTIDHDNLDELVRAEWDKDAANNAQALTDEFADYLRGNQDNIEALTIFFTQPYRRRELSFALIRQVLDKLKTDKPKLAPLRVWQAYRQLDDYKGAQPISELTALVALIRRVCGMDATLATFDDTVRRNFQNWVMKHHSGGSEKFNEDQMDWLRMIRDHVANSFHIARDDLEMSPFDSQGGLGKMYQLFGAKMDTLLDELNEVLVA
ncbi:MAG TPA: type I restriction-modification enzyme R subunit C-terminal domain-containing protein [Rugosibacter sp.]|nr:type I restriction-modification enzyme R subunit C-terminal domain-containing protein [Rugosibacter sp.]HQN46065.1 type I restriction-modification enzyme R subunit C-terminal domain-containing protein [Rugosibacter sp.]HQQ35908.1 type I restriction-modification enzyme R subunit C-terminal domain-containing protein [Rugosibacter sp.]